MKSLISVAFGAAALATAAFASAAPAEARSNVGVYVGPGGVAFDVGYRPCRDYWYRVNHPYRCGYGYDYGRYNNGYYRHHDFDYRYRHHDRDRDRHRDRDHDRRW